MFKKLCFVLLFTLLAIPALAQDEMQHYSTEDGALQLEYSTEWSIFERVPERMVRYSFQYTIPLVDSIEEAGGEDTFGSPLPMGRISHDFVAFADVEIVNPDNIPAYAGLSTPLEFVSVFQEERFRGEVELELGGYPAVRVGGEESVFEHHTKRNYAIVRDDDWVMLVSLSIPVDYLDEQDDVVEEVLATITFSAEIADEPFERVLEAYDYSDITLTETFTFSDGLFTVDYPQGWESEEPDPRTVSPTTQVRFTAPDNPDIEIAVLVYDARYFDMSAYAYMDLVRNSATEEMQQFLIDDYEAVASTPTSNEVRLFIIFAVDEEWAVVGTISGGDVDSAMEYESTLVAMLASVDVEPELVVDMISAINAPYPDGWEYTNISFRHGEYYITQLEPDISSDSAPTIAVVALNTAMNELDNLIEENGLTAVIFDPYSVSGEAEVLTIGDETVTRVPVEGSNGITKGIAHIYIPEPDWVMIVFAFSFDEDELDDITPLIEEMIEVSDFDVNYE